MARRNRIRLLAAEAGMTMAELAVAINMQPHTLRRYSRHEAEPKLEIAQAIADFFRVSVDDVLGTSLGSPAVVSGDGARKIPLYGAAEAGLGFDVSDITEPIDRIDCPVALADATNPYAVFVAGESMSPRFEPGEIVFVHPGRPIRKGDDVIVQLHADSRVHAILKRYVSRSDDALTLEQINPARKISHKNEAVKAVHKVIGVLFT